MKQAVNISKGNTEGSEGEELFLNASYRGAFITLETGEREGEGESEHGEREGGKGGTRRKKVVKMKRER